MTRRVWVGFAALCLLSGSGWALDEAVPGLLHGLMRMAVHYAVLSLVFGVATRVRRQSWPGGRWRRIALCGVGMFGLPEVLFAAAGGHVASMTELLVFLLVPVVVIFAVAQRSTGFGVEQNPLRMMVPALAGLGGAAFLIPFTRPATTAGFVWLAAMIGGAVLAGVAAVQLHESLRDVDVVPAGAVIFGAAGLLMAAFCWLDWTGAPMWDARALAGEALRGLTIEAAILLLTVWLLRQMAPVRFSARFLLLPLVTIVESYLVLRPATMWTTWVGIALLAAGAAGLLRDDSQEML